MVFVTKYRQKIQKKRKEFNENILAIIWNIIKDEDFNKLKNHKHHLFFNRYEHLINVSRLSYKIAKFFKADIHSCTLAWILHDFHETKFKWYMHWIIAAKNARKFWVNEKVLKIVESHMYPFWRKKVKRHKWIDFWIVKFADFWSMCYEVTYSVIFLSFRWKNRIKMKKNKILLDHFNELKNLISHK